MIVGTSNQNDFLPNDVSGNRRFVVIERLVSGDVKLVVEYLETHRTQLWAEAVALYRKGYRSVATRDRLAHVQSVSNEDARRRDDLLEDILDIGSYRKPVTLLRWLP